MKRLFFLFVFFSSCSSIPENVSSIPWQTICGRPETLTSSQTVCYPIYQARVPKQWLRLDPEIAGEDTTHPNCTFLIDDHIRITIHSFPSQNFDARIPPLAQIERWQRQLTKPATLIEKISHGGFAGYYLEGEKGEEGVMAWSFQLDPDLYQSLLFLGRTEEEKAYFRQMGADFTIKAVGPLPLLMQYRDALLLFAKSFELIEPIPHLL